MKKFYHDSHMHLDLYENPENIIEHINRHSSYTIAVTNLPILYDRAIKSFGEQRYIRFALGLHPELIKQFPEQIPIFLGKLEQCRYIGEIGLDFKDRDVNEIDLQVATFKEIINACHKYGGKILSIHSRSATKEVIEIVGSNFNGSIILHWFSGNFTDLQKAINNGYYFSINSDMIKSKKGHAIVKLIPLDKLLLESDGPFTRETRIDYNLSFVDNIVGEMSRIKELGNDIMFQLLKDNFRRLLN